MDSFFLATEWLAESTAEGIRKINQVRSPWIGTEKSVDLVISIHVEPMFNKDKPA